MGAKHGHKPMHVDHLSANFFAVADAEHARKRVARPKRRINLQCRKSACHQEEHANRVVASGILCSEVDPTSLCRHGQRKRRREIECDLQSLANQNSCASIQHKHLAVRFDQRRIEVHGQRIEPQHSADSHRAAVAAPERIGQVARVENVISEEIGQAVVATRAS